MFPERWQQVEEIFQAALDLEADERERYVARACGDDAELRREVEKLISQYEEAGDFIDGPLYDEDGIGALAALMNRAGDPVQGRRVGAYRLEREIGRGGMGTVYEAVRADNEYRKRVAVKLVKRGMDTDFILRRFRRERRILAALEHPNIACLLDGGTTDDGLPYFVMEYVEGRTLYRYSDAERLSVAERLRLFRQLCDAVHYAHGKHVVHRDLKPSNVLVTADGTPKLLDFGIAKLLNPDPNSDTIDPTQTALRLMTPEYASPEQVRGESARPASDIYSLGVMLYELLTGHRPYRLKNRAVHEVARVICEEDPESLSDSLTRDEGLVPTGAREKTTREFLFRARNSNLESLRRELSGDINHVVLKALRKEPADRYRTASDLRDDITRYLEGRPVAAPRYFPLRAENQGDAPEVIGGKQRNTGGEKSIAILPLKLLSAPISADTDDFLGVGLADALVTRLSNVRRLTVRPTSSVLPFGDARANPFDAGRQLNVDYVLDGNIRRAGERIRVTVQLLDVDRNSSRWADTFDERFTDVLDLEDSISEKVVKSLIPRLTGEEEERLQKRGTNSPEAYEAYLRGRYHWNQFTPDALAKSFEAFRAAINFDPDYALAHVGLCDFYIWANIYGMIPSGEALPLAEAAALRAIEIDDRLGEAYASLGLTHQNRFGWAKAEELYKKSLELTPHYVNAHEWWAAQLVGHGRFDEGVEEMKTAERLDPLSLRTKTLTAWTLYQARRFDEALERGRQIVDLDENYPQGHSQIGFSLLAKGRAQEALPYFQKFDAMIPRSALAKYQLCFGLVAAGRRSEAEGVLEEMKGLAAQGHVKPYFLGMAYAALGVRDEAFAHFEKAFAEDEPWMLWFGTEPLLDGLRDDERFDDLLRRMNLPTNARK